MPVVRSAVVMIAVSATVSISAAIVVVARGTGLELLVLFLDVGNQILTKLLGLGNHVWVRSGDMKKHVLIALMIGGCFEVAGTAALDLDTTSGFLLDVLHVGTAMTDYLSSQVETVNRFEVNGNLLLGPFPSTIFVSLNWRLRLLISTSESTLVDQLRELLLDKLIDLFHGGFKASLGCTRDMEIQGRVRRSGHAFVWVIAATGRNVGTGFISNHFLGRALGQQVAIAQVVDFDVLDEVAIGNIHLLLHLLIAAVGRGSA